MHTDPTQLLGTHTCPEGHWLLLLQLQLHRPVSGHPGQVSRMQTHWPSADTTLTQPLPHDTNSPGLLAHEGPQQLPLTAAPPPAQMAYLPLHVLVALLPQATPAAQHASPHGVVPEGQQRCVVGFEHDEPPGQQTGAPLELVPHVGPGLQPQKP
jgi:hypothetical protein